MGKRKNSEEVICLRVSDAGESEPNMVLQQTRISVTSLIGKSLSATADEYDPTADLIEEELYALHQNDVPVRPSEAPGGLTSLKSDSVLSCSIPYLLCSDGMQSKR